MEFLFIIIIGIVIWALVISLRAFLDRPFSFILMIIGLGFLFGDDECDL